MTQPLLTTQELADGVTQLQRERDELLGLLKTVAAGAAVPTGRYVFACIPVAVMTDIRQRAHA